MIVSEISKSNYSSNRDFNWFITLICIVWALTPELLRLTLPKVIVLILMFLWVINYFHRLNKLINRREKKLLLSGFIWCVWIVMLKVLGYSTATWGQHINIIFFYFLIFVMVYINRCYTLKLKKKLGYFISIVMNINILSNVIICTIKPALKEALGYQLIGTNVGDTMFLFNIMLFSGICFFCLMNEKRPKKRLYWFFSLILANYCLLFVLVRTTIFLLSILMFSFIIFNRFTKKSNVVLRALYYFVFFCIILIVYINIKSILEMLMSFSNTMGIESVNSKIDILYQYINKEEISNTSFAVRIKLYELSIDTFKQNIQTILFGIGYHSGNTVDEMFNNGIGQHSQLIDMLPKYGIIGFYMFISVLSKYRKQLLAYYKEYSFGNQLNVIFLIFILYSFANNSVYPNTGIIMMLLLPIAPNLVSQG